MPEPVFLEKSPSCSKIYVGSFSVKVQSMIQATSGGLPPALAAVQLFMKLVWIFLQRRLRSRKQNESRNKNNFGTIPDAKKKALDQPQIAESPQGKHFERVEAPADSYSRELFNNGVGDQTQPRVFSQELHGDSTVSVSRNPMDEAE
jgi:hypothetical protein